MTRRLSTSPACLISEKYELSRHMERILDAAGQQVDSAKPILEVNPDHPMVARLAEETDSARQQDWANLIFDQALLSEGGKLDESRRVRAAHERAHRHPGARRRVRPARKPAKRAAKKATGKAAESDTGEQSSEAEQD